MKKIIKSSVFLMLIFLLTGCSFINPNMRNTEAPKITKTPISGSWTVTKVIFVKDNKEYFQYKDKIGSDVVFSTNGFILDGYYFDNPTIKAKVVDSQKFLEKNYQISPNDLVINSDKLTVVNLYNAKDLVYQVLKAEEDVCYVYINGVFLQLTRVSNDVSEKEFENIKNREQSKLINLKEKLDENSKDNGILLGIKSKQNSEILYQSLYLKFNDNEIESVSKLDGIKIPSEGGVLSLNGENKLITITNEDKDVFKTAVNDEVESMELLYVSNEYLSIYKKGVDKNEDSLIFKHTDDIQKDNGIPLSKLIDDGAKIFKEEALKNGPPGYISDSNFGIKRENGKFNLIGLMVYKNSDKSNLWFDLGIDINKIIETNSELAMPFQNIKTYIPEAEDAVMSSNNRFIVTIENNTLNIYNIVNTELGSNKVYSVEIPSNSEIIQAERYVGSNSIQIKEKLDSN